MNQIIRRAAGPLIFISIAALFILLGLSMVDSDSRFLRDTALVAPWASGLAAIVLATLTALYVGATEDMARATESLAKETKLVRELSTRPVVIAELEADQSHIFWLVIRNIGSDVAREVRIHCYPDFEIVSGKSINSLPLFDKGLPTLGPGARIRTMLEFAPRLFQREGVPLQYNIRLSFKDVEGVKRGPFEYPVDFDSYRGLIPGGDVMKGIETALNGMRDSLRRIEGTLSNQS